MYLLFTDVEEAVSCASLILVADLPVLIGSQTQYAVEDLPSDSVVTGMEQHNSQEY